MAMMRLDGAVVVDEIPELAASLLMDEWMDTESTDNTMKALAR
jgi:hypothetical protein